MQETGKCTKHLKKRKDFVAKLKEKQVPIQNKVEAVICPPALFLHNLYKHTKGSFISIGAQTMHEEKEGAFTGEVSPASITRPWC